MRLSEHDLTTLKPVARAYDAIGKWKVGHQVSSCARSAKRVWTCNLQQGNDHTLLVWSENGDIIDPALNECIKISHSFRKNAE
jgi:hypothetical protein